MKVSNQWSRWLLLLLLSALPRVYADDTAPKNLGLDFAKINASIDKALTEFSASNTTISALSYSLDADKTNIEQDTYVLNMGITLPKTPWSNNPSKAQGVLSLQANQKDPTDSGLLVGVDADITTDSLAMIKYMMTNIPNCDSPDEDEGVLGVLKQRHCALVKKLPELTTIAQLHTFLLGKLAAHQADVRAYLGSLKSSLRQLSIIQGGQTKLVQELLKKQVVKAQEVLEILQKIVVKESGDGFSIQSPATVDLLFISVLGLKLEVSATNVKLNTTIKTNAGKLLLTASKPLVIDLLKGLEQQDACALKMVKLDAEGLANLIAALLPKQTSNAAE